MIDKNDFFSAIKENGLFPDGVTDLQKQSISAIIDQWETYNDPDKRRLAYIFATVYHEAFNPKIPTSRMLPIEEMGKGRGKDYGKKLKYGKGAGKRVPYTTPDKIYYGRGHTQNTWYEVHENLTKAAKKAGKQWDFLNNPELLLQIDPSAWATVYAMRTGLYTGRRLSQYFDGNMADPKKARAIINGSDKADLIASYYLKFLSALG